MPAARHHQKMKIPLARLGYFRDRSMHFSNGLYASHMPGNAGVLQKTGSIEARFGLQRLPQMWAFHKRREGGGCSGDASRPGGIPGAFLSLEMALGNDPQKWSPEDSYGNSSLKKLREMVLKNSSSKQLWEQFSETVIGNGCGKYFSEAAYGNSGCPARGGIEI